MSASTLSQRNELGGFFQHRVGSPRPAHFSSSTRLLCGAAYLDDRYADNLVAELIEDERRAVVPSVGIDLEPVIQHCFRARTMLLARDIVLSALLLVGLFTAPLITLVWIQLGISVIVILWIRRSGRAGIWAIAAGVAAFLVFGGGLSLIYLVAFASAAAQDSSVGLFVLINVFSASFVALGTVITLIGFRLRAYRALTKELAPGRPYQPLRVARERVRRRVAHVANAQWGNVILHGGYSPFVGAGSVARAWSVAMELRRKSEPGAETGSAQATVEIDSVQLNSDIRARLLALRAENLPERERVPGLYVLDHVAAAGERYQGDVLLDPTTRVPYAVATADAIEAIIRHPQGGLRYYQRVVIGMEGKAVVAAGDRLVAPAQDQQLVISAFSHIAVEGGLLYAEFLATVLPPIDARFQVVDQLHPTTTKLLWRATRDSLRYLMQGSVGAPWRMLRTGWRMATTGSRMENADRGSRELRSYNVGARLGARELAAAERPTTYLQELDAKKYTKIVERVVITAILDHLEARNIDTSEYRGQFTMIQVSGTMITGGTVTGPVASGTGATATTITPAPGGAPPQ
jgi:hypothetical protein